MSKHWPLPERFRIRLSMQADWHVGSGMGRPGNIDRLIARDADGLPFVPAKTLKGIWRDACERLCRGLDDRQLGEWSRLVDRLFGERAIDELWGYQREDRGHASFAVVDDAVIKNSDNVVVEIRGHVGIDREFASAAENIKYDRAILPRGTRLTLR